MGDCRNFVVFVVCSLDVLYIPLWLYDWSYSHATIRSHHITVQLQGNAQNMETKLN